MGLKTGAQSQALEEPLSCSPRSADSPPALGAFGCSPESSGKDGKFFNLVKEKILYKG